MLATLFVFIRLLDTFFAQRVKLPLSQRSSIKKWHEVNVLLSMKSVEFFFLYSDRKSEKCLVSIY